MQAAVFFGANRPLELRDVIVDKPRPREVLVRIAASGLCHSDLHMITGDLPHPAPAILGHEAAGIVEAVGSEVSSVKVGDHVVGCGAVYCGHCNSCLSGHSNLCSSQPGRKPGEDSQLKLGGEDMPQFAAMGGFAEQMLVHENGLVKIAREVPLDRAALLGCAVLTGVGSVFNKAQVQPGSSVVVIGCGGVGLRVVQGARIAGAETIIAVDLAPEKLELAKRLGATHGVRAGEGTIEAVREITGGGADYVFEAIGRGETIEQGVMMLARGGSLTVIGATKPDVSIAVPGLALLFNEWRVQGAFMGSGPFARDIPMLASLYMKGQLDLDTLVAERIALADINQGYETMRKGTQARSVIVFEDVLKHASA